MVFSFVAKVVCPDGHNQIVPFVAKRSRGEGGGRGFVMVAAVRRVQGDGRRYRRVRHPNTPKPDTEKQGVNFF